MGRVLRRAAAKRDLGLQWAWYAEQGGPELADRFSLAVQATLATLADRPEMGTQVNANSPDLEGVRRFPVQAPFGRMLLFYLPLDGGVDLVRVLHGSRDLPAAFDEGASDD